jgi:DNA-binding PadR family transcriptional regulator
MQTLTPTARVILGVLGLGPRTGYDIKKLTEYSTRFFWSASYGQLYPELHRLEAAGLVVSAEPAGARRRRVYELTDAGRDALHEWLTSDSLMTFDYRDEGLLKLFFADQLDPEAALAHVRRMRTQMENILAHFRMIADELARDREEDPARFPYLALDYGLAFMEWVVGWWAALERELQASDGRLVG